MNVLMISFERKLFEEGSAARQRIIEYGGLFDELHVIVFSKRKLNLKPEHIAPNIWLYPTNSLFNVFYPWDAYRLGRELIRKRHFEKTHTVVTAQDPFETGIAALFLAKRSKLKLQIQVHTDFLNPNFIHASLLNQVRLHLTAYILPKADGVRVVSEKIKRSLIEQMHIFSERITVLPIFVDARAIASFHPRVDLRKKYPQFKFIILMPTRFTEEKNISFALDVFRTVLNKYPFTGLVIVGEGPLEPELKRHVKMLDMDNNVMFEPWRQDIVSYFKTANLFLLTSRFEGYGLALIEAALSGCPIVTSHVGIAEELRAGIEAEICPVKDLACFTLSILGLIENNERRENMRLEAKHRFEKELPTKRKYLSDFKQALDFWKIYGGRKERGE